MTKLFANRHVSAARTLILLAMFAGAGFAAGRTSEAQGIGFGAGYYSNLSEVSGGEKVAALSVYNTTSDWYSCSASSCFTVPQYSSINWTISDGYSTFEKTVSRHEGGGWQGCNGFSTNAYVYAGPFNPYGTQYVYYPIVQCQVMTYAWWEWSAGMCDTAYDCVYFISHGPHITATLTPPSSSAYNFMYRW